MNFKTRKTGLSSAKSAPDPFRLTEEELSKAHEIVYGTAKKHGVSKKVADGVWRNFTRAFEEARIECIKKFGKSGVQTEGIRKTHKRRERSSGDGFPNRRGSRMCDAEHFD